MFRIAVVCVVLIALTASSSEARSIRRRHHPRGNSNVQSLLLNYQLESLGSGANNMKLVESEGPKESLDEVLSTLHGDSNVIVPAPYNVPAQQMAAGRQTLQPFKLNRNNDGFETEIKFGFPVRTPYALSEQQKADIYRKTIELCRQIRHKLSRTMNLEIECSFPYTAH